MRTDDQPPHAESDLSRLLHADRRAGVEHGALHKPAHVAAAFGYATAAELVAVFQGAAPGFVYARQGNPTGSALEAKLALLEGGRAAAAFATGMAAIAGVLMALCKAGDHLVVSRHLFGNTRSLFQTLQGFGIDVDFVDASEAADVAAALRPSTRLVFVETIANPGTQVPDLAGIGKLCADRGLLYIVDNTMTTPALLRGRAVGAGLVVHSLTKGLSGHGDAMGGAVVDTGLFDWTRWPHIAAPYRSGDAAGWGMLQIRKRGLRDFGATLRAEDAHRIATGLRRWNCGSARPTPARCSWPGSSNASRRSRGCSIPACRAIRSMPARPSCSAADSADCWASSWSPASTRWRCSTACGWSSCPAT